MAKISFYLTNPKSKTETKLFCFVNYGLYKVENGVKKYLPLKYYTNIELMPDLWNKDLSRAKESKNWANPETLDISVQAVKESARKNYEKINSEIELFERKTKELINSLSEDGNLPTHEKLRIELDKLFKPNKTVLQTEEAPKEFFPFIDFFIKTVPRKENTIKSYVTLKNSLLEYQKDNKTTLTFEKIDIDFYNSYIDYLTRPKTIKTKEGKTKTIAGLSKNTIGTRIKILKTFLSSASERGIKVPTDYTKKSFKKPTEETFSIYLNESELITMYNKSDLPLYLERVRDLFLIGCYTGLRFSDLSQLKKENITSENTINITTQKTNQKVVVPIHPVVREIFLKYDYKLPKLPSNQKFNDFLKLVAEKAEINELIHVENNKGGFIVGQSTKKYNLVTSHTARRSFATNAFLADMPSISIMKITGHKTESAFMKYIKMSAKDNAIKMQSHKFFNPMLIAK
jgi:integrase